MSKPARLVAQRGLPMPQPHVADVGLVHAARLDGLPARAADGTHRTRSERRRARIQVRRVDAVVRELNARQCPVLVHRVRHQGQRRDVVVTPQPAFDEWRQVARVVDFGFFRTDDAPAARCFHAAHCGQCVRHPVTERIAMGHLVEPVRCLHRADLDGLEQNIESGRHLVTPSGSSLSLVRATPQCNGRVQVIAFATVPTFRPASPARMCATSRAGVCFSDVVHS